MQTATPASPTTRASRTAARARPLSSTWGPSSSRAPRARRTSTATAIRGPTATSRRSLPASQGAAAPPAAVPTTTTTATRVRTATSSPSSGSSPEGHARALARLGARLTLSALMANSRTTHKHLGPPRVTPASVLAEVVGNIKAQPLGLATVADLGLPDPFAKRVAGRILQSWYHERFRVIVDDSGRGATQEAVTPPAPSEPTAMDVRVVQVACGPLPADPASPPTPPPSRGFRPGPGGLPYDA